MDILIKNIELKGSLLLTPKAIFKPVEEYDNEKIVQKWEIVKDAEIVPVPEHGRLIDADELADQFSGCCSEIEISSLEYAIYDAPTVLEASNGTDN